jgi:hypothetical protein
VIVPESASVANRMSLRVGAASSGPA